jgi:hypothetical protein
MRLAVEPALVIVGSTWLKLLTALGTFQATRRKREK